jgi:hypothetical protein
MAVAFGVLGLAPAVLWSMTVPELEAAIRGRLGPTARGEAPSRADLRAMMAQFPD